MSDEIKVPHPPLRRTDRAMSNSDAWRFLEEATVGRLATVGPDGWPYITPLSYAMLDDVIVLHHVQDTGHLNRNLQHDNRICFEVDEEGAVISTGPTAANATVLYRSVIVYGTAKLLTEVDERRCALDALVQKYVKNLTGITLPEGIETGVAIYSIIPEHITGKERKP